MNPASLEVVKRYLAGELDLDSAAHALHVLGAFGIQYSPGSISAEEQERIEALVGRTLWLSMREANPASVPPRPFSVEEFRAIAKELFGYEPGEGPVGPNDRDPNGAA